MKSSPILAQTTVLGILLALSVASANGAVLTPLNIEFGGGDMPVRATAPWVTGRFADEPGGNVLGHTRPLKAPQFGYWRQHDGDHVPFRGVAHPFYPVVEIPETPGDQTCWVGATEITPVPEASPLLAAGSLLGLVCAAALIRCRRWLAAWI